MYNIIRGIINLNMGQIGHAINKLMWVKLVGGEQ